ncbi:peptidoglycan DD-metalloendopeptidase family protein [Patescibacteria group bacterium]|nr:peptidoglycan DD-metalloendopeptidase family protein [Patescibacteria group bacterium]MBU1721302.1 peptidoglycan DD-metalloendopeptidase family protein [Patescibacteria group bacterium]MBU1900822.1 peptidoglycan DD-metalloendopeptidase family protein [Patescibacteria group bacterium]
MAFIKDKILMVLLRVLVRVKRVMFWLARNLWSIFGVLYDVYAKTIGFRIYKIFFLVKKKSQKHNIPLDSRFVEVLGRRGLLQVGLFVLLVMIMIPYSTLYTQEVGNIHGRDTLLYKIIGPGDQNFGYDEITIEEAHFDQTTQIDAPAWKEGAVAVETHGTVGKESIAQSQELAAFTSGGAAITKPNILPGVDVSVETPTGSINGTLRKSAITYTVQSGDVIGKIAEKFGIDVNTILWANDLTARSYIRPGDDLTILPENGVMHTVKSGETVSKIAKEYNAESESIVAFNKLQKDGSDIVIGEELFIPGGEKRTTVIRPSYVTRPSTFASVTAPPPSVSAPAGSGFLWPSQARIITQYYGWRHTGLDIGGPIGTPLYASKAGTVIKSQCGWNGGYGCYIILDHGGGVQTLYAHASQLYVSLGETVTQGQTIAGMGSTGNSTGPHIHYEVRINGQRMNPLQYVR